MTIDPSAAGVDRRRVERVLLEYEGPYLTVLRDGERQFLGYAADEDEDEGVVRWLQVPVSHLEIKALHRGKLTLRSVLAKSEVLIYDTRYSGEVASAWIVPLSSVPTDSLPDSGVPLPEFARDAALATVRDGLAFECDGEAVRNNSIMFSCLAALTHALQGVWSALARRSAVPMEGAWNGATLAFAAGGEGSFAIEVDPQNRSVFEAIAAQYKSMVVESCENPAALQKMLTQHPGLADAYGEYVEALETYKIDIFADWEADAAFLGHDCASRFADSSPGRPRHGAQVEEDGAKETIVATGYFDGFMRHKRTFEFFDISTGTDYAGRIPTKVAEELADTEIVVGRKRTYTARIEVVSQPEGDAKHRLLGVEVPPGGPRLPSYI